jgi:hypothetical protein
MPIASSRRFALLFSEIGGSQIGSIGRPASNAIAGVGIDQFARWHFVHLLMMSDASHDIATIRGQEYGFVK